MGRTGCRFGLREAVSHKCCDDSHRTRRTDGRFVAPDGRVGDAAEYGTETDPVVEVCDETGQSLSRAAPDALPTVERDVTVVCASGERRTATWTGVPLTDLFSVADVPETTTHLRVTSDDGYRACLNVRAVLEGLLALAPDGDRLASVEPYETRLVAPDIDGERMVKGVERLEPLSLPPEADPTDRETLSWDTPTDG